MDKFEQREMKKKKTLFEQKDDYYKPIRVSTLWNNSYIEYEINCDRNKKLSVKEYLDKIKPYFNDVSVSLQKSDMWKAELTIAIKMLMKSVYFTRRVTN